MIKFLPHFWHHFEGLLFRGYEKGTVASSNKVQELATLHFRQEPHFDKIIEIPYRSREFQFYGELTRLAE